MTPRRVVRTRFEVRGEGQVKEDWDVFRSRSSMRSHVRHIRKEWPEAKFRIVKVKTLARITPEDVEAAVREAVEAEAAVWEAASRCGLVPTEHFELIERARRIRQRAATPAKVKP